MKPSTLSELVFPRLLTRLRQLRLWRYKKNKLKQEKTSFDRDYLLKFKVKINDKNNSQVTAHELELIVPAKAAFFAKRKALKHIQDNIELVFVGVDEVEEVING